MGLSNGNIVIHRHLTVLTIFAINIIYIKVKGKCRLPVAYHSRDRQGK